MPILQTLYQFGLAAANIGVVWLHYGVLNAGLGVILTHAGVIVALAAHHETSRPTSHRSRTVPHRRSRQSSADSLSEAIQ